MSRRPPARPAPRPGKPGGKRDQNRRQKEQALSSSALELFLEKGIEGASIDDITRKAETAKGSFYRYFPDKSALVEALFAPAARSIAEAFAACDEGLARARTREQMMEAYRKIGAVLGALVFSEPGVIRLYLQECHAPGIGARAPIGRLRSEIARLSIALTNRAHEHGLLRPIPPEVSALAVIGATERLLFAVLSGEEVGNPLDLPQLLTSLILDGLRAK